MMTQKLPRFALLGKTTGRRFSFNAKNLQEAVSKASAWCRYQGMSFVNDGFQVEELPSSDTFDDLHNEYPGVRE